MTEPHACEGHDYCIHCGAEEPPNWPTRPAPVADPTEQQAEGGDDRCAVYVGPRLATTPYDAARYRLAELTTPMGWRLGDVIARLVMDSGAVLPAPVADPSGEGDR